MVTGQVQSTWFPIIDRKPADVSAEHLPGNGGRLQGADAPDLADADAGVACGDPDRRAVTAGYRSEPRSGLRRELLETGIAAQRLPRRVTQSFTATAWSFTGFLSPISNTKVNGAKAGSAVPVKFSLGGDRGLAIFAVGFPTSAQVTCPAGTRPTSPVATTSAKSGLSYNALTGIYTYVWETKASWKGTCRLLRVKLADNSVREASFRF